MIRKWSSNSAAAIVLAAVLTACGGGGGGSVAGIDGTGVIGPGPAPAPDAYSFGTVTGFGSIIVNGVRFDTSSASFVIDGQSGSQDDLDVGDVVLVVGSLAGSGQGTATLVAFDDAVEGPIESGSIDAAAGTFVVLGQTVRVSAGTSFDDSIQPPSLDGLVDGATVEVAGFFSSDGSIDATRIEAKPAGTQLEVTGLVSNLDSAGFTFDINALAIDYGSAMLEDFPGGMVSEGDIVEVKGDTIDGSGALVATRVELKSDDLSPDDGDDLEIEGFITRFVDATDFDVSGFPVTTTALTTFDGGSGPADLGLDVKVEVEGTIDASGVLVAREVEIRRASAVRLAAVVDSVDAASSSFVTLGITITVDALTRIEDKRDDVSPFSVGNLAAGDYVEVRGSEIPAGSGELLATLIERDDFDPSSDDTELRGFVQSVTEPEITILGVTIMTDGGTDFEDESDGPISADTFFDQVRPGDLVEGNGIETGPQTLLADEVEFENE